MTLSQHVYEVRPRKDHRGVDLISYALSFGRLWYGEPNAVTNAIGYAEHRSRSHDAVRGGKNFSALDHRSGSRDEDAQPFEANTMRKRWPEVLERDPYYNPNLSREHADFSLSK